MKKKKILYGTVLMAIAVTTVICLFLTLNTDIFRNNDSIEARGDNNSEINDDSNIDIHSDGDSNIGENTDNNEDDNSLKAQNGDEVDDDIVIASGDNNDKKPGGESDSGGGSDPASEDDSGGESNLTGGDSNSESNTASGNDSGGGSTPTSDSKDVVDVYDTITISAAGDVTLGRDHALGYSQSFDHEYEKQNYDNGYFFRNVKSIFEKDDLTIVNLETTLTNATKPAEKTFRFKADPSYVDILKEGDIEVVSIANNHTLDYLEEGFKETLSTLDNGDIGYFGYEHKYITDIRGVKIGILGYTSWNSSDYQKSIIKQGLDDLKSEGAAIIIVMFHWGIEKDYYANSIQKELAYYTIDNGADLVLGGHPHVVQGIEEYNGKQIVYSLGNFSFGGNRNPSDHDTFIYVHKFNLKNGDLISYDNEVIPCSISSVNERNNYQPTPLEGEERVRVLDKIEKYSNWE